MSFVLTESGRVLDTSDVDVFELVDGHWIPARSPLMCDELFNARVLSNEELRSYMEKSGKSS